MDTSPFERIKDAVITSRCEICRGTENLSRCARCKHVFYCSREHQSQHFKDHKKVCVALFKASARCDQEELTLRNHPGDFMMQADPFTTGVGHFWGILDTRDYMRARYGVVEALLAIDSQDAVYAALEHCMDMLRLCRSDNMGLRDRVAPLMLRLDLDQQCYDFIKWYHTTGDESDYELGNMDLPFLDTKDADVFEPPTFMHKYSSLSFASSILLLKIKLLVDVVSVRKSAADAGTSLPRELLDNVQKHVVRSPILKKHTLDENNDDKIDVLKLQAENLFKMVENLNPHLLPCLLDPGANLGARPEAYSQGSREEMQITLQYIYKAWVETRGALGVVEEMLKRNRV